MAETLLERMMARTGDSRVPRFARESFGFRASVMRSGEFRRIEALPRRLWDVEPFISNIVNILTEELKTPTGLLKLWPIQAAALSEIALYRGAFLPIAVGRGKTLISLLAPRVLNSERPILFVPAQLREKTKAFDFPQMLKQFRLASNLRILGYSELSLEKNKDLLEELKPDLIILDECHRVKNKKAGRTRRLVRYFKEYPDTSCVAMSGTVSNRSIKDFAHILEWCLKERAPLPSSWRELCEWADALDEKVPDGARVSPGALKVFCTSDENVRQGFRRRLVETPAVVATEDNVLGTSLVIMKHDWKTRPPDFIFNEVDKMRHTWTTPNGDLIAEKVELWRHVRETALGFYYRWDPPAPKDWMDARREWKRYVRETLRHNQRRLDTELQVWNDCKKQDRENRLSSNCPWYAWREIKDEFEPKTVAEWLSDYALLECSKWLKDGGICWVEHREFGRQLQAFSGVKYYGAGDDSILSTTDSSLIASIASHSEGKNLQRYSRNLIVSPMTSGKRWEQLLGRTHREGQEADEVFVSVFLHFEELEASFEQARMDARFIEDTIGNLQKLNYANVVI